MPGYSEVILLILRCDAILCLAGVGANVEVESLCWKLGVPVEGDGIVELSDFFVLSQRKPAGRNMNNH